MIKLFLGYESRDEEVIRALVPIIKALGLDVWEFKTSLELGDTFTNQIEDMISVQADGAIFLLTENTSDSDYIVKFEIPWATDRMSQQNDFPIFFLILNEDYSILDRLKIPIAGIQSYKLTDMEFETLIEIGEQILSKMFDLQKSEFVSEFPMKICDRPSMAISEDAVLNCKWYEILGTNEEVPADAWKRLQVIIKTFKHVITSKTNIKTLLIDAKLRYTSSFLLGYEFRQPTGFTMKILYQNQIWKTPDSLTPRKKNLKQLKISISKPTVPLILDVSLSHSNLNAIREYITSNPETRLNLANTRISLQPKLGTNRASVTNGEEAQDISLEVFDWMSSNHKRYSCTDVHMFYNGPFPIAIFLGWLWNKAPQIYLYEFDGEKQTYFENPYKVEMRNLISKEKL